MKHYADSCKLSANCVRTNKYRQEQTPKKCLNLLLGLIKKGLICAIEREYFRFDEIKMHAKPRRNILESLESQVKSDIVIQRSNIDFLKTLNECGTF
jgi:hypothetical protein